MNVDSGARAFSHHSIHHPECEKTYLWPPTPLALWKSPKYLVDHQFEDPTGQWHNRVSYLSSETLILFIYIYI